MKNRLLILIGMLMTFHGKHGYASTAQLSEELLGQSLEALCMQYRDPLSSAGNPQGMFRIDLTLAEKRRVTADDFAAMLASYVVPMPEKVDERFAELGHSLARRLSLTFALPKVFAISQKSFCRSQAQEKLRTAAPGAQGEARRKMLAALESDCMEESWGRANYQRNEVYFSEELLAEKPEGSLSFAYLHELCHVRFPAVTGSIQEEIFCDAVATQWLLALGRPVAEVQKDILITLNPPNPYKDFLLLRAHLPEACLH